MEKEFASVEDFAEMVNLPVRWIRKYQDVLPHIKPGKAMTRIHVKPAIEKLAEIAKEEAERESFREQVQLKTKPIRKKNRGRLPDCIRLAQS